MKNLANGPRTVLRTRRSLSKAFGVTLGAALALTSRTTSVAAQGWGGWWGGGGGDDGDRSGGGSCFLRGTKIRTIGGYRNVEELAKGDILPTVFNGTRAIQRMQSWSVRRVGPQSPWPRDVKPVRIVRSAIGDNVPEIDLFLTASHCLLVDDVLVPAGDLVNGTTIKLDEVKALDVLEYYHIKLESHDVIDAQGAPCETLFEAAASIYAVGDQPVGHLPAEAAGTRCAPLLSFSGGRSQLMSRLRSAASFCIDRRQELDVIRDCLEERGLILARPEAAAPPSDARYWR